MIEEMRNPAKPIIAIIGIEFLMTADQGHYNPRSHVHESPAKPGHMKQKHYH
jgi:hypothetical protein